jgi:hypothetical protein
VISSRRRSARTGSNPRAQLHWRCQIHAGSIICNRGGVWKCAVLSWDAQLEDAKKEIADLEQKYVKN